MSTCDGSIRSLSVKPKRRGTTQGEHGRLRGLSERYMGIGDGRAKTLAACKKTCVRPMSM